MCWWDFKLKVFNSMWINEESSTECCNCNCQAQKTSYSVMSKTWLNKIWKASSIKSNPSWCSVSSTSTFVLAKSRWLPILAWRKENMLFTLFPLVLLEGLQELYFTSYGFVQLNWHWQSFGQLAAWRFSLWICWCGDEGPWYGNYSTAYFHWPGLTFTA